jgi:hypothetical protein
MKKELKKESFKFIKIKIQLFESPKVETNPEFVIMIPTLLKY